MTTPQIDGGREDSRVQGVLCGAARFVSIMTTPQIDGGREDSRVQGGTPRCYRHSLLHATVNTQSASALVLCGAARFVSIVTTPQIDGGREDSRVRGGTPRCY